MKNNVICWFEIYVQDMNRAQKFYEAVFSLQLEPLESPDIEMRAFPMSPGGSGATGALVKMEGCPSGGNSTLVYFNCEDCSVEAKRAAEHGGKIFKEKFSIGQHGFIALIMDTEDNLIGLHSLQ